METRVQGQQADQGRQAGEAREMENRGQAVGGQRQQDDHRGQEVGAGPCRWRREGKQEGDKGSKMTMEGMLWWVGHPRGIGLCQPAAANG